ncbi:unnamed protein product [Penicillium salamii]|nr:unnamed protein product [Penicillium salamii]CAG8388744.1 unnamed protein product [Penicillium salamii]
MESRKFKISPTSRNSYKQILNTENHCAVVERPVASPSALKALRNGLRFNITPVFINEFTAKFIQFLNDPAVKLLGNGQILEDLLLIILEPRTLWNSFVKAFCDRQLDENATHALCWLTTELLSLPASLKVDIGKDAQTIVDQEFLFSSPLVRLRNSGHKIKYLLEMKSSATALPTSDITAGGRHDNDFADFRLTAILPTADEMGCTEKPFYRGVEEIAQLCGSQRIAGHLDNQFRLLREDMLSSLRDDFQIANGSKSGRRFAFRMRGLSLSSICCSSSDERYLRPCTLGVTSKKGLEKLKGLPKAERKNIFEEHTAICQTLRIWMLGQRQGDCGFCHNRTRCRCTDFKPTRSDAAHHGRRGTEKVSSLS